MTRVMWAFGPGDRAVAAASIALGDGLVVALPTDTLYGLCADPYRRSAIDEVFALTDRPREFALPILVAAPEGAEPLMTTVDHRARRLMDAFWPGALTIVVPRRAGVVIDVGISGDT